MNGRICVACGDVATMQIDVVGRDGHGAVTGTRRLYYCAADGEEAFAAVQRIAATEAQKKKL